MTVLTSGARPRSRSRVLDAVRAWPHWFWVALALYLLAHILLRLWETPNIGKNEVQEAVAAQAWAWGYHPRNPPLHTWMLMGSYAVFGANLLAHVVLKYVLVGGLYGFAYLSARRILSSKLSAAFSALSITLLAPYAWTVHTASTHTLLMAVLIFATLWAALQLTRQRRVVDYAAFGITIGLGLLAKYSFPLFLVPLICAMLWQRELRSALLTPKMLVAAGVLLLVLAPHLLWMATARFDFVEFLAEKQAGAAGASYLEDVVAGLAAVATGAFTFLFPLCIIAPVIFRGAWRKGASRPSPWASALLALSAFGLALLVLDVLVLRAVQFEERYMTCALLTAPLALFAWLERRDVGRNWVRPLALAIAVVCAIGFVGLAGRALIYHASCNRCWEEMPIAALVDDLRAEGFVDGTIIADHYNVAGNMRLAFPHARTFAANYHVAQPEKDRGGQCLLVWNARNAGDPLPPAIVRQLEYLGVTTTTGAPSYIEAPLHRSADRIDRFGYWLLPNADGNCTPTG